MRFVASTTSKPASAGSIQGSLDAFLPYIPMTRLTAETKVDSAPAIRPLNTEIVSASPQPSDFSPNCLYTETGSAFSLCCLSRMALFRREPAAGSITDTAYGEHNRDFYQDANDGSEGCT